MEPLNNGHYERIVKNAPFGYARHRMILDEAGAPVDYEFIEVNGAFERLTGLRADDIIGRPVTLAIPGIRSDEFDRIAFYGEVARNGGTKEFEQYSDTLKKWYKVQVYSYEKNYFTTIFIDITSEKKKRDITEKKSYENTLRKFKQRLELVMDASEHGFWDWNLVSGETYFSPAYYTMLGYKYKELPMNFDTFDNLIHPEDKAAIMPLVNKCITEGKPYEVEFRLLCKNGAYKWIQGKGKSYFGEGSGRPTRAVGIHIDIDDRKKFEEKLRQSEERLSLTLDITGEGIWDWDIIAGTVCHNRRWCRMLGLDDSKITHPLEFFVERLHPDDRDEVIKKINEAVALNRPYESEHRMVRADGSTIWVLDRGGIASRNETGEAVRMIGSMSDITERKKYEEALRDSEMKLNSFFSQSLAGFFFMMLDEPVEWNDSVYKEKTLDYVFAHQRMTKINKSMLDQYRATEKEFLGLTPNDFFAHDLAHGRQVWKKFFDAGHYHFETNERRFDGSEMWVLGDYVCMYDSKGRITGHFGIQKDITDRKNTEAGLVMAKESAETANRAKSEFLANMSHEIRTPLNGVIGFTDLLLQTPLNDIQKQYADNAYVSAKALLGIINDILDFSKIEAGKLELDLIEANVIELAEQAADIIKFPAGKKRLELLLDVQPGIPQTAIIDPVWLRQILINLLNNAVKFTEKGEVELKVGFSRLENGKARYDFSVRDTGIGITPEQQTRLFKAFSQADSSTTRKFGGTGLGLIISNLLAEKMGGGIRMKSEYGKGSVFYFSIEAETVEDQAKNKPSVEAVPIKRVLVVDDNEANRTILKHNLSHWGIECVDCDNGLAALKTLETSAFDLMVTDYDMPYVNGLETVRMIREKLRLSPETIPIILLHSSADDRMIRDECAKLGVRFNLVKPVKARELHHLLKNIRREEKGEIEAAPAESSIPVEGDRDVTFLIAEDVEMNMQLVKIMVKKIVPSAKIIEARNGKDAVAVAGMKKIDVILMDVQMPEMDGVEAAKTIRAAESAAVKDRVPIIALTAGAIKEEREKCLKAGMDDFITKPIEPAVLRKTLEKYIKYTDKNVEVESGVEKGDEGEAILSFDRNDFMDKAGGDRAVYKELVEMSFESSSGYVRALEKHIKERNINEIKKVAHSLRGLALTVCFNRLARLTMIVEKNVETDLKSVSDVYELMKAELKTVEGILRSDEDLR